MLEIIALIFLTRETGRMAANKGLRAGRWKVYTILSWFAGEIVGAIIGVMIFGPNNLISVMLVALAGAITGFFILRSVLLKKPDVLEDDIDQIGRQHSE